MRSLIPWHNPMRNLLRPQRLWDPEETWSEMERFWQELPLARRELTFTPTVDITEEPEGWHILADIPGVEKDDLEIVLRNDVLALKGKRCEESKKEGTDYLCHERQFGAFERDFTLPPGVDVDKIDATFKNGMLDLFLPKGAKTDEKTRKINIH